MGLWWNDINTKVVSFSDHHFDVNILDDNNTPKWRAIGIYGWAEQSQKHNTWTLMSSSKSCSSMPCIMFGEFNEITSLTEKEGGVQRSERSMDAFREAIDRCHLRDLGFKGNIFTWERGNSMSTFIRERLDRFLAGDGWMSLFPDYEVRNFPIYSSDHAPIMVYLKKQVASDGGGKSFKFERLWLSREDCVTVVDRSWKASLERSIDRKIARCGEDLSSWARKAFGSVKKKIKDTKKRLRELKEGSMDGATIDLCRSLAEKLDSLYMQEESFWFARARANELRDGDKNTKYFHHKASQRRANNRINGLSDQNGNWLQQRVDLERLIEAYFRDLFESSSPTGFPEALEGIEEVVSTDMNESLDREPTGDEIKAALFQMHPNKAPGPDEFRPISCCNVIYKIISKMMANKWKGFLGEVVSQNQSAFVPKRLITDNAIVAFEIFHNMKRGGGGGAGNISLKLDMSKAYDRVEWSFLGMVMKKMGFSEMWISRIMACLESVNFSFKINGKISGSVSPTRGLRQGDPISPYLFLLCADAFSTLLNKAATNNLIHGARICKGAPRVSHLFFADDSILFARANVQECSVIADIISKYERASG
ncbi:uncharacterized protein LOC110724485 [Chenopodium quinoa]|uniref:uncharacterized protein LOC110724485 n=1 Tax=Chenopodium quinoa TaxID=63459 RepID=UPI000B777287|nr:uncharacterized protein LOC110724485 [Chenopodium quinoa]